MSDEEFQTPYAVERLVLVLAFVIGIALVWVSVSFEAHKLLAKLAEAIGTALLVAAAVDVFFNYVRSAARTYDRRTTNELRAAVQGMSQWLADRKHAQQEEQLHDIQTTVKQLSDDLRELARSRQG